MRINERRFGTAAILDLHGAITGWEASAALDAVIDRLVSERRSLVVLNLSHVADIDSRGLGALVAAHGSLERAGGALRLAAATKGVRNLVVLSRLLTFFDTFETVEDAVADVRTALASTAHAASGRGAHFAFWPGMQRLLRRA